MDTLEFDYFMWQLVAGENIDQTCFYFNDDKKHEEHYLGFITRYDNPYWVGYCDIESGTSFKSAEELVNAPIFDKRTLKERWNEVRITSIGVYCLEDWIKYCHHV